MAAYAALVSVMQIIDQIQRHPRPPISLHKDQAESLTKAVTFLQDFLEGYNPHISYTTEADPLESRIAEAAYAAEDVIESYIVDQIHARRRNEPGSISSLEFCQGLQKVIEEMDLIKMKVVQFKMESVHIKKVVVEVDAGSFRSTSTASKVSMVGFDDALYQMLDKVTGGRPDLQIIPIVGMGGIGKTTLARNIYIDPLVKEHFDVRAWSTISQEYNALEILKQVLDQVDEGKSRNLKEDELGEQLYKYLIGKRYLIVMDDMWSIEAWDRVRRFFPTNEYGSRVVVTTRLSNLASQFSGSNSLNMKFLDEASSWTLFSNIVFRQDICPPELEDIGKKIVKGCKGLPLSISVIGGLLSKTGPTRENWELIEENLNSNVNLEDNERCLRILYMSYNNLPVYLKPCFLFVGMFPAEDEEIVTLLLIPQWVAEGFLKPSHGKNLEEVGERYLEELIERNLILVEYHDNCGKILSVKIHDLLRDLSLREAQKVKFSHELVKHSIPDATRRRIRGRLSKYPTPVLESLESTSLVRSLIGNFPKSLSHNFRLLRVSMCKNTRFGGESIEEHEKFLLGQVNLRLFHVDVGKVISPRMFCSVSLLWNLQTVMVSNAARACDYIFEIWKMPQLRHVLILDGGRLDGTYCFPTVNDDMDTVIDEFIVMENLQTLITVNNLNLGEEVPKRIPNIKWLHLYYNEETSTRDDKGGDYCLNNLSRFQKLESLDLEYSRDFQRRTLANLVTFPCSLNELTLKETKLHWEDVQTKLGSLPLLQALSLKSNACIGSVWQTFEGQFSSLRILCIESCDDLEYWKTDNTHFPRLEDLHFRHLDSLNEIPLSIGDIPTLRSISLYFCSDSVMDSAQRIREEQEAVGNEDLQIKT